MTAWHQQVQTMVGMIDEGIRRQEDDALTLSRMAEALGYSPWHLSRHFREIAGVSFRAYLQARRLSFALREVRDTQQTLLDIAVKYGFSSHEAFSRAFRRMWGVSPSAYRRHPTPVTLRTSIRPLDCYLLSQGGHVMCTTHEDVKTYFVTMPAHKFLHIRNYESIGYWDFWQKQSVIPGQDCETICGLLDSVPGKLDDLGGDQSDSAAGQVMAFINEPAGRVCSWGIPLAEAYGVRLPADWAGDIPSQMQLMDVPAGEYVVFEHGPFDFATENVAVEAKIEAAMRDFDYAAAGYALDTAQGRVFYFFHDCERYWKYVRPVKRTAET